MQPDRFHGLLIVDKPAGWTSHDVVARIRRLLGQRSVGHAGTLDPAATGVLPIAVGSALRGLEYLTESTKSYRAEITLGLTTDALDIDGRLTRTCAVPALEDHHIRSILSTFLGPGKQVPPVFSAIKIDGTPLYARARRGDVVGVPERTIEIHRLELIDWQSPALEVDIVCSKGFYVRSFARDFGERAGTCGFLSNLIRTRVGPFTLCDAWTLDALGEAALAEAWERIAIAPDAPAHSLDAIIISSDQVRAWEQGKRWDIESSRVSGPVRVYDSMGIWLGIGEISVAAGRAELRHRKVIPGALTGHEESR